MGRGCGEYTSPYAYLLNGGGLGSGFTNLKYLGIAYYLSARRNGGKTGDSIIREQHGCILFFFGDSTSFLRRVAEPQSCRHSEDKFTFLTSVFCRTALGSYGVARSGHLPLRTHSQVFKKPFCSFQGRRKTFNYILAGIFGVVAWIPGTENLFPSSMLSSSWILLNWLWKRSQSVNSQKTAGAVLGRHPELKTEDCVQAVVVLLSQSICLHDIFHADLPT
ncbi:hypothetical protein TNIN_424051 [Trichonephila inaurata madagascariensis]|uniref:Uncharacterized protein n=1 Tax=Trichonephila inaurata madagascariensis TaxID=2747483 RepID=A0A8X6X424_9ARAC|nr:hypothetical protein TNIN_424051 [Trichonephila inaurata madagascariensis]